jgi:hypothetical protein
MASGIIYCDEYKAEFHKPKWLLMFCWLPQRSINGKFIWMRKAYRSYTVWMDPEHYLGVKWMTQKEYTVALLREEV